MSIGYVYVAGSSLAQIIMANTQQRRMPETRY